jgi:hypothetical protein
MSLKLVWTFTEYFVQNGLSEVGCVMGSMEFFLPSAKEFSAHHSLRFLENTITQSMSFPGLVGDAISSTPFVT